MIWLNLPQMLLVVYVTVSSCSPVFQSGKPFPVCKSELIIPDTRHHGNGTARLTGGAVIASSTPPGVHSTTNLLSSTTPLTESEQPTTAVLLILRLSVQPQTDAETMCNRFLRNS